MNAMMSERSATSCAADVSAAVVNSHTHSLTHSLTVPYDGPRTLVGLGPRSVASTPKRQRAEQLEPLADNGGGIDGDAGGGRRKGHDLSPVVGEQLASKRGLWLFGPPCWW